MKGLRFLLLSMGICLVSGVKAQFYSSENVYCYQYVKTVNDGVTSKLSRTEFYFINFQKDMMGYTTESSLKQVRQRLLENPNYYKDRAINNLAEAYNKYKSSPAGLPTMGPLAASVTLIKFCSEYSSSKYTYRNATSYVRHPGNVMDVYLTQNYWSELSWGSKCYTFSRDRSELIIWSTSDSENRDYYKLVDTSSLKPNTDFLD